MVEADKEADVLCNLCTERERHRQGSKPWPSVHGHGYWVGLGVADDAWRCHHLARVMCVKWWGFAMGFADVCQGGG